MRKLKSILAGITLGVCIFTAPVFAAEEKETDYRKYFDVTEVSVIEKENKDKEKVLCVIDENEKEIFSAKIVDEDVYTTVGLNVREVPTTDSIRVGVLAPNSKVKRIGDGDKGWVFIEINEEKFFVFDEYITIEKPENVIDVYKIRGNQPGVYSAKSTPSTTSNTSSNKQPYKAPNTTYVGVDENAAKEEIARRESGGDYNAMSKTGKYVGRYQLTNTYLNGDYSPENQEKVADEYVKNRYGSWEAALAFHNAHGWY